MNKFMIKYFIEDIINNIQSNMKYLEKDISNDYYIPEERVLTKLIREDEKLKKEIIREFNNTEFSKNNNIEFYNNTADKYDLYFF